MGILIAKYFGALTTSTSVPEGASALSLKWTIFRPLVIFGPGDSLTNRFAGLLRLSGGFLPLARASARFAPVSVEDVARAFRHAVSAKTTIGQTYELCGPEILTLDPATMSYRPQELPRLPPLEASRSIVDILSRDVARITGRP